eukprot:354887-Chlamydomonas_euryale.AAC.5
MSACFQTSESGGSSGSEGVEAVDPPVSKRIRSITDFVTQVTVAVGFERKGGQIKLLSQCLARYKPPGGRHGWPISYGQL